MDEPSEDIQEPSAPEPSAAEPLAAPEGPETPPHRESPPPVPLSVGWLAGPATYDELGGTLKPTAIGLAMDELVQLAALCPEGMSTQDVPSPPVEIVQYEPPWWWRFPHAAAAALASEVRKRKIKLLHALDVSVAPLAGRVSRLADVNYVASVYSVRLGRSPARSLRDAAALLPAAEAIRAALAANGLADRATLVNPGVHVAREVTCFRDSPYSVSILAGGRMNDFVSFAAVLRSFAELNARKYDCAFFMIGNGRAEKQIRSYADKLGLQSALQFVDRQPPWQFAEILKGADLYVSPAPTAEVDLSALSAMAAGVPVFAADGVIGDFLVEGRTAMRFEPGNSAELTIKLISLLDDRPAARDLAAKALDALRGPHSPAQVVASLVGVYRQAAEQPRPAEA